MTVEHMKDDWYKVTQKHALGASVTKGQGRLSTILDAIQSEYENISGEGDSEDS